LPSYPEDSLQHYVDSWWESDGSKTLEKGRLIRGFVHHVDEQPRRLIPIGRAEDATEHSRALVQVEVFRKSTYKKTSGLPVAAFPLREGEEYFVFRGKVNRPMLILAAPGEGVPDELRRGAARYQTAPTLLVAPYYGVDRSGKRGGWSPAFVDRIRHIEYPQYMWDALPTPGAEESILRLDHVLAVGRSPEAYDITPHRLTEKARGILDEWLCWIFTGKLDDGGPISYLRTELRA